MRLGFVGTGSMGAMLLNAFSKADEPTLQLFACNRSPDKLKHIASQLPQMQICETIEELVPLVDHLFVCVRPSDSKQALAQIEPLIRSDQILYTLVSATPLAELESHFSSAVVKVIPSITQMTLAGVCLVMLSNQIRSQQRSEIFKLLSFISEPVEIREEDVRACADITSCGPAFVSLILQEFEQAGIKEGNLSQELSHLLLKKMILGLAKLIQQDEFTYQEVIRRVAVPGGVTAEGIRVLQPRIEGAFEDVLRATKSKQKQHAKPSSQIVSE